MAKHRPKPRNGFEDSLPVMADEWNRLPAEVEQAYRRGFQQGLAVAIEGLRSGATADDIEEFTYGIVHAWRYQDPMRWSPAPRMEDQG
ncbi:MAG TPA: hypothetical protein PLL20_01080 [Phycisphaerae bacterium]|nr:hypothetical protein [Phycisphaerae bacterium]HRR84753.1 hypothetical protein [Phycisphaerae bacterium]